MIRRVGLSLLLAAAAPGQEPAVTTGDPYTGGDPSVMRRNGYVTFAPESFRPLVDKHLPNVPILWVETKHFVLGSALATSTPPRVSRRRRAFEKELAELRIRLPVVKRKVRRIDPWLHLHLYARRLETLYDEMQFLLRVRDEDFPETSAAARRERPQDFMGWGRYLGMAGKFRVLILSNRAHVDRLESAMLGRRHDTGSFHYNDRTGGGLTYVTCLDNYADQRDPQHTLRCQLRFNLAKNLLDGFRHYDFDLPVWLRDGVGNLLLRDLDPGQFAFSAIRGGGEPTARNADWAPNVRRLVQNGLAPGSTELCRTASAAGFSLNDHMACWSRLDYLRSIDEGRKLARFLRRVKRPIESKAAWPSFEEVLAAQAEAFEETLGSTLDGFDAAWREYVLRTYPRR